MSTHRQWLRANFFTRSAAVDRDNARIAGVIAAEEGPFKSRGRGEFDRTALQRIVALANTRPGGLKSNWTHPSLSNDGLGDYLGRFTNARLDTLARDGRARQVVRMDLQLDPTALEPSPNGSAKPRGEYVMDLAESDPEAFGTSLQLQADQEYRLDTQGRRQKDADGEDLPPLWMPTHLHALDVVSQGDATNSFLAPVAFGLTAEIVEALSPNDFVAAVSAVLDTRFPGLNRERMNGVLRGFLGRYLDARYGVVLQAAEEYGALMDMPGVPQWGDRVLILDPQLPSHQAGTVRGCLCEQKVYVLEIEGNGRIARYLESQVILAESPTEQPPEEGLQPDPFGPAFSTEALGIVHTSETVPDEPELLDRLALPRAAFADLGLPGSKGTWLYPHHFERDGTLYLHRGALETLWERQGRLPPEVRGHLQLHRLALGLEGPSRI